MRLKYEFQSKPHATCTKRNATSQPSPHLLPAHWLFQEWPPPLCENLYTPLRLHHLLLNIIGVLSFSRRIVGDTIYHLYIGGVHKQLVHSSEDPEAWVCRNKIFAVTLAQYEVGGPPQTRFWGVGPKYRDMQHRVYNDRTDDIQQ